MNRTISVIIPVYNVEAYLRQCLDSVLSQSYDDLQVILIDDGSTDASGMICDEYAAKDQRITVIHQKNGGAAAAKNALCAKRYAKDLPNAQAAPLTSNIWAK